MKGISVKGEGLERGPIEIIMGEQEAGPGPFRHVVPRPSRLMLMESYDGGSRYLAIEDSSGQETRVFIPV